MQSFLRMTGLACWLAASGLAAEEKFDAAPGLLRLPVDRRVAQQLETAANDLAAQELSRTFPLLEDLWLRSGDQLYGQDTRWKTVRSRIRELILRLPDIEQKRFWQRIEAAGADVSPITASELPTRTGLKALLAGAAEFRDRGEPELAAASYAAAARHPAATPGEIALIKGLRREPLAELEGSRAITAWLKSDVAQDLGRSLTILGERTTLGTWLNNILDRESASTVLLHRAHDRPALTPLWKWETFANNEFQGDLKQSLDELRSQGVHRLPTASPAIVGDRVVMRTPFGLACLSTETGDICWFAEDQTTASRSLLTSPDQRRALQTRVFAKLMFPLVERLQVNTLLGALSHDEQTIYQVVPSPLSTSNPNPPPVTRCALEAVDVASGRVLWRIGEPKTADDPWWQSLERAFLSTAAAEFSICGPPVILGSRLYFLGTLSSELMFFAVDKESRQLAWSAEIGHLLPNFGRPTPRGYTGCRPVWTGELLICPTASGGVAAFDPVRQRSEWFTRIPVDTPFHSSAAADATASSATELALRTWREAMIVCTGGRLVCISPESQAIHCLEETTGEIVCAIPRGNGLSLLGAAGDRVYVLEPTAIRAHDLTTGAAVWRTVIGEIRGRGAIIGDQAVQPLADGAVAVIELPSGRRIPGGINSEITWGNLIPLADGWLSIDEFRACRFPDLAVQQASPVPTDAAGELAAQRRNLEAGDFAAVREYAASHAGDEAQDLSRTAHLAELRFEPQRESDFADPLLALSASKAARGEALLALGEAALTARHARAALEYGLDGLALGWSGDIDIRDDTVRRVRWDRAIQGIVMAAIRAGGAEQQLFSDELIIERWDAARNSPDPFALQQWYQQSRTLPTVRRQLLNSPESVFLGAGQLMRELSLMEAGDGPNQATRIEAAFRLRQEWRDAGFPQQAEDVEHRLLSDFPGGAVSPGSTVRQRLSEDGTDFDKLLRRGNAGPEDRWPRLVPKFSTETEDILEESHRTIIPLETDGGSLWERLEVGIDRYGRRLQFSGAGQSGSWSLELPKASTGVHPYSFRGWTIGHLLIVRIGTLLAAVSPFDDQGAPHAKLLWSLDLLGTIRLLPEQLLVERIPTQWKLVGDEFRVIDGFHRDLGQVSPLRAGYLCFQQQGKLVAVETLTGRRLWERWDVLPGTIPWGDNDQVLLWHPGQQSIEVLSVSDGRTIGRRNCRIAPLEIWHESAGTVWTGRMAEELVVECRNLVTDQQIWERRFPKASQPVPLDHRTGAVVDPRGLLHLFDLLSGEAVGEALTIDIPQPLERVAAHRDESRWYLSLSGSLDRVFDWQSTQPFLGYRRPMLRGPLYAIDRATRQIVWRRELSGEPWLIDQHPDAPVLVQIFKRPPPVPGQGIGEGVLRVFDKRTGEELLTHRDINLVPYVAVDADPDLKRVTLKTEHLVLQLDYDPPPGQ